MTGYDLGPMIGGGQAGGSMGMPGMMGPQTTQFGFNVPTAQLALSGLGTIGSLISSFQANGLAKKAFRFQRDFANTNLRNQTQAYNTTLEDKIGSRAFVQGMSKDQADAYLSKNKLVLPASAMPRNG
jgi:hypothetical protein